MAVLNGSSQDILTGILACPTCRGDLSVSDTGYRCDECRQAYPIHDDVPFFAEAAPDQGDENEGVAFRKRYEWHYQGNEDAAKYDESFRTSRRKRQRTRRELHILSELLGSQPRCHTLLDIPCGGGRLSAPITKRTTHLLEADISPAQLDLAMACQHGNQRGLILSALSLPFEDESVDGAVCARLSHHLPDPAERDMLLTELLRVSRSFVVFSFTDRRSIQSWGRRLRGKAINPSAMATEEITAIAARNNATVVQTLTVSSLGPRHRYSLIVKQ